MDWLFNAQIRGAGRACSKHWEIIGKWFSVGLFLAWLMSSKYLFLESEKWFCWTQTDPDDRKTRNRKWILIYFECDSQIGLPLSQRDERNTISSFCCEEKRTRQVWREEHSPRDFYPRDNNMKIPPPLFSSWWLVLVCSCQYEECIDFSQELSGKGILRTVLHKSLIFLTKHPRTVEWRM